MLGGGPPPVPPPPDAAAYNSLRWEAKLAEEDGGMGTGAATMGGILLMLLVLLN